MAADSGTYDDATIARKQKIAQALFADSMKPQKIENWAQGLAQMARAGIGGYLAHQADEEAKDSEKSLSQAYLNFLRPAGSPVDITPSAAPQAAPTTPAVAPPMGGNVAQSLAASPDANLPRGFRNMNPGNIEDGPFARSQPGYAGTDGRFAKFASMDNGTAAMGALLDSYGKRGLNTVNGIINRWAPSSDGNNVSAYAADVASKMGIGPDDPITPEMQPKLIAAMAQHENGQPLPASGGNPVAAALGGAGATPEASGAKGRIAALLSSSNAQERKLGRALAQGVIANEAKGDQPTDEIKEYNLAVKQAQARGEKVPTFFEYKTGIKKAGAQNISIDQKPELAFDTKAGQLQAERFNSLAEDGQSARQMVSDINTLTDLGRQIGTGKGAQVLASLGPYADALGVKVKGLDEVQAYEAIVNRLAPNLRVKGSGAQSDYELRNFLKSLPNLGNTTEGNEISSAVLKGLYENKIRAAEIGADALNKKISRSDAEKALRELPDPMEPYRAYRKAHPEQPKTTSPAPAPQPPAAGAIMDGFRFKGGDPSKRENWEPIT